MFLDLFSLKLFTTLSNENLLPMKRIQKHLRQLLQTVSTSKMLGIHLCLDALFGHFKQSANKPSPTCQSKSNIATKAMDGLFKYNGNRA